VLDTCSRLQYQQDQHTANVLTIPFIGFYDIGLLKLSQCDNDTAILISDTNMLNSQQYLFQYKSIPTAIVYAIYTIS